MIALIIGMGFLYCFPLLIFRNVRDIASPYIAFLGIYVYACISEPIRYLILRSSFSSVLGVTIEERLIDALLLSLLGLVAFQLVYFVVNPKFTIAKRNVISVSVEYKLLRFICYLGLLFSSAYYTLLAMKLGPLEILEIRAGAGQFTYGLHYSFATITHITFYPFFFTCLYCNYRLDRRILSWPALLAAAPYCIVKLLLGSKHSFILPLFGSFLLVCLLRGSMPFKRVVFAVCVIVTIFVLISLNFHMQTSIIECLDVLLRPLSYSTAILTRVMDIVDYHGDFFYGQTYINSFLNLFIPSFILPPSERFITPVLWFKEIFYPHITNLGLDFSMLAEAYLNFGGMGIPLLLGIIAAVLKYYYIRCRFKKDLCSTISYLIFLIGFLWYIRSDSQSLFKQVFYSLLLITVMEHFVKLFVSIGKKHKAYAGDEIRNLRI